MNTNHHEIIFVWLAAVAATLVFYLFCLLFVIFSPLLVVLERKPSRKALPIEKSTNKSRRNVQIKRCSCHKIETLERKETWLLPRWQFFTTKFKDNEANEMLLKFTIKNHQRSHVVQTCGWTQCKTWKKSATWKNEKFNSVD